MKKILLIALFFLTFPLSNAQNLDSLLTVARSAKNDSVKISKLNEIAFYSIFNDTNLALNTIKECEEVAVKSNDAYGLAIISNTHGIYMDVTGKSDSAKYYFSKALDISKQNGFVDIESNATNNLGMYHWNTGQYNEALSYFIKSLELCEENNNRKSMGSSFNNIGLIYQEMSLYDKALEYHDKALAVRKEFNLKKDQVASYNNIGICYRSIEEVDKSIEAFKEGLAISKEINNLLGYYRILDNLGNAYQDKGNYKLAIESYKASLNRPDSFKADEKTIMATYSNMTSAYNYLDQPKLALTYAKKGFEILQRAPQYKHYAMDLYLHSAESNYMLNNISTAREQINKYIKLNDSLFSEENAKAIADLEVKYDTEKKGKEILIQRAEIAEQNVVIQRRNYQVYGLIGVALILGLIGYLFYNQQRLKNRQLQKENELKDALLKIETQNKLQEQRLRISRDLHDNIGAQLTFIISSIDNLKYGFNIKDKALTDKLETISTFTSGTIYELRDTIWAMNKDNISFEDLKSRITNFIDKAKLASSTTNFEFSISDRLNQEREFTSLEGINIHRIIQEAVNNSLKHAQATHISVTIDKLSSAIKITIKDDGKGFDANLTENGNGLSNMNKRAKMLGGDLEISSDINSGTEITLTV